MIEELSTDGVDATVEKVMRAVKLHKRGVTTEIDLRADIGDALLDMADAYIKYGRQQGIKSTVDIVNGLFDEGYVR